MNRFNLIRPLLCLCLVAVLAPSSVSPASITRTYYVPGGNEISTCIFNGNTYQVGEIISLPGNYKCIKYRCNSGGVDIAEEGCEHNNVCRAVGSTFEDQCTTYSCSVSERNGARHYQTSVVSTRCRDYYGNCQSAGSQFTYAIGNQLFDRCSCRISGTRTRYTCSG